MGNGGLRPVQRARNAFPGLRFREKGLRFGNLGPWLLEPGSLLRSLIFRHGQPEERAMPVFILWAVPAVFVLGGLTYMIVK